MNVVEKEFAVKNDFPKFVAGDTVTVHYKIKEGNKERIQQFSRCCYTEKRQFAYRNLLP